MKKRESAHVPLGSHVPVVLLGIDSVVKQKES